MSHSKKFLRDQRLYSEPVPSIASLTSIEDLTDPEVEQDLREIMNHCTSREAVSIQYELQERAFIIGWKGSPMQMPARLCLAAARKIKFGGENELADLV